MDQRLFFLINGQWTYPALDFPMAAMSSWAFWGPFVGIASVLLIIFGGFRGRAAILCIGLAVGLTDGVIIRTIKKSVGRPRPNQVLENVRMLDLQKTHPRQLAIFYPPKISWSRPSILPVRGNSFPSAHAANNFAAAVILAIFYRRWGWLYFIPAALIAYSRIYVGSHYPSDTLVAIILGAGLACFVLIIAEWLWRRFASKVTPNLFATHPSLISG